MSDSDVLGTMGLVAKQEPLAAALQRLFAGDNNAAHTVVAELAALARYGGRVMRIRLPEVEASDMAKACLAWHRDGVCKDCGGHGLELIPGTKTHGERRCKPCKGSGRVLFDRNFPASRRPVARFLVEEMEREMQRAGPEAMKLLAPKLEL